MATVEELLAPIASDEPAGPDLSDGALYAEIERAYRDADVPPSVSPTGVEEEPEADFAEVVALATAFLESQSKDLKIAALLAAALLREKGFSGLADGLELCRGLLDRYWEELHPGVPGRAAVLGWLGSEDVSYAVYQVPFTESGHTYLHYKEWAKREHEGEEGDDDAGDSSGLGPGNFRQGFAQTPRAWYDDLSSSLDRAAENLESLDSLGRERFPEADERPPRYRDLADALRRVTTGARDLLDRKPAPVSPEPAAEAEEGGEDSDAPAPDAENGGAPARVTAEPRDPEEAQAAVVAAARVLRRADPGNPAPYLLLRGFRWGELRAGGERLDPRTLIPPRTEQRTRLKTLFLDQRWDELLEAGEEIMATPVGRAWLDLQRYEVLAAERLGAEYRRVADALRGALRALIIDLPDLVHATLMDDSAAASRDTVSWLESQGLIEGEEKDRSGEDGTSDTDPERRLLEASFARAADLVRAGDPQGAVELLMDRAEHERSQRARFMVKAEAAAIMVRHEMKEVARPILDELHRMIEEHKLEGWESGDTVAKPLGLLYRCLAPADGGLKQKLYQRLAKLDPLLAMRVREDGTTSGQAGQAQGGAARAGAPQAAGPAGPQGGGSG